MNIIKWMYVKTLGRLIHKHINKKEIDKKINNGISLRKKKETINGEEIIISLTTFPQRINSVKYTLYSLINQDIEIKRIMLFLSEEEFPKKEQGLPSELLLLTKYGVDICWCENYRSYNKIIHAARKYKDEKKILITADDDIYYPSSWASILYEEHCRYPSQVIVHRAHKIIFKDEKIKPYNTWPKEIDESGESFFYFLTGVGGVLYISDMFDDVALDDNLFTKLAPLADDVWLWGMSVRLGKKIRIAKNHFSNLTYTDIDAQLLEKNTLASQNVLRSQNDIQLENVIRKFPEILEKLCNEKK